MKGFIDPEYSI